MAIDRTISPPTAPRDAEPSISAICFPSSGQPSAIAGTHQRSSGRMVFVTFPHAPSSRYCGVVCATIATCQPRENERGCVPLALCRSGLCPRTAALPGRSGSTAYPRRDALDCPACYKKVTRMLLGTWPLSDLEPLPHLPCVTHRSAHATLPFVRPSAGRVPKGPTHSRHGAASCSERS